MTDRFNLGTGSTHPAGASSAVQASSTAMDDEEQGECGAEEQLFTPDFGKKKRGGGFTRSPTVK